MSRLDALIKASLLREDESLLHIADATEEHTFSPAFEKALEVKIHSGRKGTPPMLRRIVALVAAATLLVGSAFAFWDELIGLFVTAFPQYAELRIAPNIVPNEAFLTFPADWTELWIPEYMADGYTFISATESLHTKQLSFISANNNLLVLEQSLQNILASNDTEGHSAPNVFVSGYIANAFEKEIENQIFRRITWTNGNTYFKLCGFTTFDELITIGESISLREIGES